MITTFDPNNYSAIDTFTELYSKHEDAFDRIPAQVRSVEWVIRCLASGGKVLDVGCGTGKPAGELLVNAGLDVIGIDITPRMIEIARSKVPNAEYVVADSRTWEPSEGDAAFDGIVSYFAFLAAVSQSDIRNFFLRAYRWLQPGGVFVFGTVPIPADRAAIKWLGRDVVVSSLSAEENIKAIKDAGFVIEKREIEAYRPKAAEVGLCNPEDVWEEEQLFVYCRKPD